MTAPDVRIADAANATVDVTDGGQLNSSGISTVGRSGVAGGTVTLSGSGLDLTPTAWNHAGSLELIAGIVSVGSRSSLNVSGASGVLFVRSGAALRLLGGTVNTPALGTDSSAAPLDLRAGTLNVAAGAVLIPGSGSLRLNASSGLDVNFTAGTDAEVGSVTLGGSSMSGVASLTVEGGSTLLSTNANGARNVIGFTEAGGQRPRSTVTLRGAGTRWDAPDSPIDVGGGFTPDSPADGTLDVLDGAAVSALGLSLGQGAGVAATLRVRGVGSTVAAGPLTVGFDPGATALAELTDGARVTTTFADVGGRSGPGATGSATVRVAGLPLPNGDARWTATGPVTLGAAGAPAAAATLILGGSGTLDAQAGVALRGGTLRLDGGTLRAASLDVTGGQFLFNAGTLALAGNFFPDFSGLATILGASPALTSGRTLEVGGTLDLQAPLTLDGGTLRAGAFGAGTFRNLDFRRGTLDLTGGTLTVGGALPSLTLGAGANLVLSAVPTSRITIDPAGLFVLDGGTARSAGTAGIVNNGEVRLSSPTASLVTAAAAPLTNNGLLLGTGRVEARLANAATGQVRAGPGDRLVFTRVGNVNLGLIEALGTPAHRAEVELLADLANAAGASIAARDAVLRFTGGLDNAGTLFTSFGTVDVVGPISNDAAGRIVVTGNSQAVFHEQIKHNAGAEIRVTTGSTAVFLGPVTGAGAFTGGGAKFFDAPGGSALASLDTTGFTAVSPVAALTVARIRERALEVSGTVSVLPNGTPSGTSRLGALAIALGGTFDLADNDLVVDAGDLALITAFVADGRLTTSLATPITHLAVLKNQRRDGSPLMASFSGQGVDASDVLVKYTYTGDANADGRIDAADFYLIDSGRALGLSGYANGDFDHTGGVPDASDYLLIDAAFLKQGAPLSGDRPPAPFPASVPEPASVLPALLSLGLVRRRSRR